MSNRAVSSVLGGARARLWSIWGNVEVREAKPEILDQIGGE